MTCQNIEDNNLILKEYDCQIPAIQYGKHLEYIIPQETSICNDEVARKAMYLIGNKTSNCSRQAFLSACNWNDCSEALWIQLGSQIGFGICIVSSQTLEKIKKIVC